MVAKKVATVGGPAVDVDDDPLGRDNLAAAVGVARERVSKLRAQVAYLQTELKSANDRLADALHMLHTRRSFQRKANREKPAVMQQQLIDRLRQDGLAMTYAEISELLEISEGSVSAIVNTMIKAGKLATRASARPVVVFLPAPNFPSENAEATVGEMPEADEEHDDDFDGTVDAVVSKPVDEDEDANA